MPVTLTAALALFSSLPAMAGEAKVDVCHMSDAHSWHLITVAESAVPAHLAHGDWLLSRDVVDDVDNDCDGEIDEYFEPAAAMWFFYGGVQDNQVTTAYSDGTEVPPMLVVTLAEEEFLNTWDPRYSCTVPFTVVSTTGTSEPDAWFDWAFTLTSSIAWDDVCDNVDPAVIGGDPWEVFSSLTWEMTVRELDDSIATLFEELYTDWWYQNEPYLFAGNTRLDGEDLSQVANESVHYGQALVVDDDMNISSDMLTTDEVAAGSDGYYMIDPLYIWTFWG